MTTRIVGVGQTYTTIASAVAAAVSGDTISILAGRYEENVILPANKKLKLSGVDKATCIIDCSNAAVGAVNPSKFCALYISATTASTTDTTSGIEVENLTLIGKESPAGTETGTLYVSGRHGFVKIHDCIITAAGEYAVFVDPGTTINAAGILDIYNNTINGQTYKGTTTPVQTWTGSYFSQQFSVQNIPRQMVMVYGTYTAAGTTAFVRNNTITGSAGANDANGIYHSNTVMTCDAANVTITGNTFSVECKPLLTGSFALRARGNNCTVSNNTFIDPFTNGYVLDNKILTGANGTNNVTYTTNNIVFADAKSNYTFEYVTYNNNSVSPSPKTIPVGFVRNGWKLNKGSLYLYVIGLGKIQFSDMTSFLVAAGTSGAHTTIEAAHSLAVDGNEIIADNAISAPAVAAVTKNVAIRSASTAYLYNSNAILSYNLASSSHLLKIMPDAVKVGVPKVELEAFKVSTTGYTELVKVAAGYGVLKGHARARELVAELEAANQPFGSFLLDDKIATNATATAPSFTASGNVYVQEDLSSVDLKYYFRTGFSNANATKRATGYRVTNPLTYAIEVAFDDYNVPTTQSIVRTMQPGDHMWFLNRSVTPTSVISWKRAGTTGVGATISKAANGNVLGWDGLTTKVDILSKTLYVAGSAESLSLGITPTQIIGTVSVAALPSTTIVDIAPILGTSSPINVTSTSIDIPDSLDGQINTVTLSNAVLVPAGQQLVDAVGDSKVVITKPAADAPATIPVRVLPNDNASAQVASIEVPAGGSQVAVEVKPNGVIASSGAIKIKSPTSNPIKVIDLITGIEYTGIDISIGSGSFGSFTQPTRVQIVSF